MVKNAATMRLFRGIMTTFTEEKAISDMIRADDERAVCRRMETTVLLLLMCLALSNIDRADCIIRY